MDIHGCGCCGPDVEVVVRDLAQSQYWISVPPPSLYFSTPIPLVSVGQVRPRG